MHVKVRTPCSYGRGAWEDSKANPTLPLPLGGKGCEIQPNGGVDFREGCALECGIQLKGAVDFWAKAV